MNQEAILALEAGLPGEPMPQRPSLEQSRLWLEQQVWTSPVLDQRRAEEILVTEMTISAAEGSLVIVLPVRQSPLHPRVATACIYRPQSSATSAPLAASAGLLSSLPIQIAVSSCMEGE